MQMLGASKEMHSHNNITFSEYVNLKLLSLKEKQCTQDI